LHHPWRVKLEISSASGYDRSAGRPDDCVVMDGTAGAADVGAAKRSMTVRGAAFLGIGSMVGAGIFALLLTVHQVAERTRHVVSEPLGDLAGAWNEVPESSYGVVHDGHDELHPFRPRMP
jgi:hypothetical protein